MKIGDAEGTPEEIRDYIAIHGLNAADFFIKKEFSLHWMWILIPCLILAIILILLLILDGIDMKFHTLLFLLGASCASWAAVSIQIKFKNGFATTMAAIAALLILLVAAGFMTPKESLDAIKGLKSD